MEAITPLADEEAPEVLMLVVKELEPEVVDEPETEVVDEPEVIEVVEEPEAAVADEPEVDVDEEPLPGRMPEVAEATTELSAEAPREFATLSMEEKRPP